MQPAGWDAIIRLLSKASPSQRETMRAEALLGSLGRTGSPHLGPVLPWDPLCLFPGRLWGMIRVRQPDHQHYGRCGLGGGLVVSAALRDTVVRRVAARHSLALEMRFALLSVLAQAEGLGHLLTHPQS